MLTPLVFNPSNKILFGIATLFGYLAWQCRWIDKVLAMGFWMGTLWSCHCLQQRHELYEMLQRRTDAPIMIEGELRSITIGQHPNATYPRAVMLCVTRWDNQKLQYGQRLTAHVTLRLDERPPLALGTHYRCIIQLKTPILSTACARQRRAWYARPHMAGHCTHMQPSHPAWRLAHRVQTCLHPALRPYSTAFLMYGALLGQFPQSLPEEKRNIFFHLKQSFLIHLWVVSGFHFQLLGRWIKKILESLFCKVGMCWPAFQPVVIRFTQIALLYSYTCLFLEPTFGTRRAFFAILMQGSAHCLGRRLRPISAVFWPICAALCIDPLQIFSKGTWLTLHALLALKLSRYGMKVWFRRNDYQTSWRNWVQRALSFQLVLSLFLSPLQIFCFSQWNYLSPFANFFATKLFEIWVFPLLIAGLTLLLAAEYIPIAALLVRFTAAYCFTLCDLLLRFLSGLAIWVSHYGTMGFNKYQWLAMSHAVIMLLCFPLLNPSLRMRLFAAGAWQLTLFQLAAWFDPTTYFRFFDVQTGLAVLIYRRQRATLYDTGSSRGQWSFAAAKILPFLRWEGIRLEQGLVSHLDNDHFGGFFILHAAYPNARWFSSSRDLSLATPLISGHCWNWNQSQFKILWPPSNPAKAKNRDSLVVRIETPHKILLLTGDIGKKEELALLENWDPTHKPLILQIPHHGSATSSSYAFLKHLHPEIAVISVGAHNPWRLPHASTLNRLTDLKIPTLSTALHGEVLLHDQLLAT